MNNLYVDGSVNRWHYLGIDEAPPSGKMHVLTIGHQSTIGDRNTEGIIAWAPLMKRDKAKEALQKSARFLRAGDTTLRLAGAELASRRVVAIASGLDEEQIKQVDIDFLNSLGIAL